MFFADRVHPVHPQNHMAKKKHDVKAPVLSQSDTKDDDGSIALRAGPSQKSLVAERIVAAFEQLDVEHDDDDGKSSRGPLTRQTTVIDVVDSDDDETSSRRKRQKTHTKVGDDAVVDVESKLLEQIVPFLPETWEYEECSQVMFRAR